MHKLLIIVCCIGFSLAAHSQAPIPLKNFVQLPDVENVSISPSGNKMAMLKRVISHGERVFVVEVTDLNSAKKTYPVVRRKHEFDVFELIWASDHHILLKIDVFTQLKLKNTGWNPKISERRLMVLNLKDNSLKNILGGKAMNRFQKAGWQPQFQDNIVDLMPNDPEHILHAVDWDVRQSPQVFKVNLNTLERKTVLLGRENWRNFITDQQSNVRVGVSREIESGGLVETQTTYEVHVKNLETNQWSVLAKFEDNAADRIWPLGFLADPNMLLVEALHEGRDAIFKIDLTEPTKKTLYYSRENGNTGSNLVYSNKTNNPIGYRTTTGIHYWDKNYQAFAQGIDEALPDTNNYLRALTTDENKYLIYSTSDVDSGTYYLGDRKEKSLNPVAFAYNGLDPANLIRAKRQQVTARDGHNVTVFVTRPNKDSVSDDEGSPTIIYSSHGREQAAVGGFDYRSQLWANLGYTVVQVNFRNGRGSYYDFMQGDVSQWSPSLYNDLVDVSKWSIEKGYTNKNKICLFGQSYAGYVALMAAAKNPEVFKCVAAVGAMSDINKQLFSSKGFVSYEQIVMRLSDDPQVQRDYSPISFAAEFAPTVMLVHGEDDATIRVIQSKEMHKALSKNNKKPVFIEIPNEDSNFTTDQSRLKVYEAMSLFFEANLQ